MLKTCFGLSSLRGGVNVIAVINMIFTLFELLVLSFFQIRYGFSNSLWLEYIEETNQTALVTWQVYEATWRLVCFLWVFLLLATNICLKQSTFIPAPHKIYTWLVINYATLLCWVIHLASYVTLINKAPFHVILFEAMDDFFKSFINSFLIIIILTLEIVVVHSYYIEQKKAILTGVVQIKWKQHISKKHVSQGTAYTSASTFKEAISCRTQDESSTPPFITNVLLDRA